MTKLYNPREIYDPATMPLVEGWELNNNCTFVRFHWVPTEAEQKYVDQNGGHIFYRHTRINTKMSLATSAGVGVPGWDPFYGMSEAEKEALRGDAYFRVADQCLGTKLARGKRIQPTGLEDDPRVWQDPDAPRPRGDVLGLLRDAATRYEAGVQAEYERQLAEHAALKKGSWAQRAAAPKVAPTLAEARESYEARLQGRDEDRRMRYTRAGVWHEWEIVEIAREQARQDRVERAWQRAEAAAKRAIGPTWGGGT
jgi:hypothetical protein